MLPAVCFYWRRVDIRIHKEMVSCPVTYLGAFIITVLVKGKALQERKCGSGGASVFNKYKNDRDFHSCCEDEEVREGSNATLIFYTDLNFKLMNNTLLEITRDTEHDLKEHVFEWNVSKEYSAGNDYLFDCSPKCTLILSIHNVTSSHTGKYAFSHFLVSNQEPCLLRVRNDFHSCCEDQNVRKGSNATLIFYTDLNFKFMNNTLLEVTRDTADNYREHVFEWNVSKEYSAGNDYLFDCSPNCTLILSIHNVTSSHTGKYALSHSLVSNQSTCLLRVRNDGQNNKTSSYKCRTSANHSEATPDPNGQNNKTSSYKCRTSANHSEATPDPNSLVGSGDRSDYKVPTIIAISVTLGIVCLITIVLCTAKKHRCVCFKERQNQTFENGHKLLELNSSLSEKEDFIKEEIENV